MESFFDGKVELRPGDCREILKSIPDNSIDSVVTDPPYALVSIVKRFGKASMADDTKTSERSRAGADGYARSARGFMGKTWDTGETAFAVEFWQEVFRVLKPGGHVASFSGTRTYHRMAVAIEDAGFEIRDQLAWVYGSGFPKSHDVSKGIDKAKGAKREKVRREATPRLGSVNTMGGDIKGDSRPWIEAAKERGYHELDGPDPVTDEAKAAQGWGTALKPAWEPICLARKPLIGTVAANVLEHGTGALNIDGCRVEAPGKGWPKTRRYAPGQMAGGEGDLRGETVETTDQSDIGRWPANLIHDGSEEVLAGFPRESGGAAVARNGSKSGGIWGESTGQPAGPQYADSGSAARFFYTAKADGDDRLGSKHPTVKPVDLMQWLCRLITPSGGIILDPFSGTGTTGEAAYLEGFRAILVEREAEYQADIRKRMSLVVASSEARRRAADKRKQETELGGIFEGLA